MPLDAQLPQSPFTEPSPPRSPWPALARLWAPAAASTDPVLGYESALPWTLGLTGPLDPADRPY